MAGAVPDCFHERSLAPPCRAGVAPTMPARVRTWMRAQTRVRAWRLMPVMRSCLPPCSCSHARLPSPACVPVQTGVRACARMLSWSRRMQMGTGMGCASADDRRRFLPPCMFRRPHRIQGMRAWLCARSLPRSVPRPSGRPCLRMGMMGVRALACGQGWSRGRPCREGFSPSHGPHPYGIRSPAHHLPGGLKDPPLLYRPSSHLLMILSARRSGSRRPPISLALPTVRKRFMNAEAPPKGSGCGMEGAAEESGASTGSCRRQGDAKHARKRAMARSLQSPHA